MVEWLSSKRIIGTEAERLALPVNELDVNWVFLENDNLVDYIWNGTQWVPISPVSINVDQLKAYWQFNESSGDLINLAENAGSVDSLGAPADGQNTNVTQGETGIIGDAYLYNGTTGFTQIGTSVSQFNFMHNTTALWTCNIWINKTLAVPAGQQAVMTDISGTAGDDGISIFLNANNAIVGQVLANGNTVIGGTTTTGTVPADTDWHMITVTYDQSLGSANMHIYVDNVEAANSPYTKTGQTPESGDATGAMRLGGNTIGTNDYSGKLDELSIFNRVLGLNEINDLWNDGFGTVI